MSDKTKIEWTDRTWNPVRGCTKISPGCTHCYAHTFAERWRGVKGHPYEQGFDLRLVPEKLSEPTTWKKPCRVFVNSMSDLFHEGVSDDYIRTVCDAMLSVKHHTYQVLTKRAERMSDFLGYHPIYAMAEHIWWGVSVEDRKHGLPRVDALVASAAHNKFLSVEPLLEPVKIFKHCDWCGCDIANHDCETVDDGFKIDWVIVGGESGPHARPCNIDWIRDVMRQCREAQIPVFVKQLGSRPVFDILDTQQPYGAADSKGGNPDQWPEDLRVREWPKGEQ